MKISFITTVFNEEKNILKLLESLKKQTKRPDEIIICDGGSADGTVSKISNFIRQSGGISKNIKLLIKKGNRSVGRNEAINNATGDIIVCSDAGCILDKDWVKNIVEPFKNKKIDVVAGYYKGLAKNIFQKCLVPYVLVMPDAVNADTFLPATRSMAFRKETWKTAGMFPVEYSDNEDFVFAKRLSEMKAEIIFKNDAIAYWIPRGSWVEAYVMFLRFARGDMEARILRPKVILIFVRYLIGVFMLIFAIIKDNIVLIYVLLSFFLIYLLHSINKNFRYVKDIRAVLFLPLLQLVSDIAVLAGTMQGLFKLWVTQKMR